MRLGISTACLYPMYTEQALKELVAQGFRLFEIFFNSESERCQPLLKELKNILNESGSELKSVHPYTSGFESFLLFTKYQRRFEDGIEFYKRYFDAAAYLGAEILVLHGDCHTPLKSGVSDEEYFERFAVLAEAGRKQGICVAQENVNLFRSQNPDFIRRMTAYLHGRVHYVLDVKQAVRAGFDPYEMCAAMGECLVHVHLNDNRPGEDCLLPGKGTMDYSRLLSMLKGYHYDGDFIIEVYRKNFGSLEELNLAGQRATKLLLTK